MNKMYFKERMRRWREILLQFGLSWQRPLRIYSHLYACVSTANLEIPYPVLSKGIFRLQWLTTLLEGVVFFDETRERKQAHTKRVYTAGRSVSFNMIPTMKWIDLTFRRLVLL